MWNNIAACKVLAELDAMNEHVIHKQKLHSIKSRINNKPPRPMPHVKQKGKKKLEESKNLAEIHHNNQILLEKLEKVKGSVQNFGKIYANKSGRISRTKFDEAVKIDSENNRILTRIQSAKSHYSNMKHEKDYVFSKYLSDRLSENARRIPRVASYNNMEVSDFSRSQKNSRPLTSNDNHASGNIPRPISAKNIKAGI